LLLNQDLCNNIKTLKNKNTLTHVAEAETPNNFCFSTREKASSRRGLSSGSLFSFPKYHHSKNTFGKRDS